MTVKQWVGYITLITVLVFGITTVLLLVGSILDTMVR